MRFSGICLITKNVPRLIRFYEEVLRAGARGNEIHAEIETQGASLAIYSKSSAEEDMGFDFRDYSGTGLFTLGFSVDDVDAEYERLKKLGVTFVALPTTHPWGSRAMQFRDPDGNMISFAQILLNGRQ